MFISLTLHPSLQSALLIVTVHTLLKYLSLSVIAHLIDVKDNPSFGILIILEATGISHPSQFLIVAHKMTFMEIILKPPDQKLLCGLYMFSLFFTYHKLEVN